MQHVGGAWWGIQPPPQPAPGLAIEWVVGGALSKMCPSLGQEATGRKNRSQGHRWAKLPFSWAAPVATSVPHIITFAHAGLNSAKGA